MRLTRYSPAMVDLPVAASDEATLAALRAGDEAAFEAMVSRYGAALLRLARVYCPDAAAAEEAVGDAWLAFLESLDRFEGRSSLKTWLYGILINCARARARRESRSLPLSSVLHDEPAGDDGLAGRFLPRWVPAVGGHWIRPLARWDEEPEQLLLRAELRARIKDAIEQLPEHQRLVITLRDVEGLPADEVCNLLGLSDTNQRVLLHRARLRVRRAVEQHLMEAAV